MKRILLVEDEPGLVLTLRDRLSREGYAVETATDGESGLSRAAGEAFDLVLRQRDYFMPGPQALFGFMRSSGFAERAAELGGYDVTGSGSIRHVN